MKTEAPQTILITAGPTREYIDPVRFISNESSGTVGWELAREAKRLGHRVILVLGPVNLPKISGVETISIQSAVDMLEVLKDKIRTADVLFMSAAVADFTPEAVSTQKIKRGGRTTMTVKLKANPDILKTMGDPKIKKNKTYVGFCIETENLIANARKKLEGKNLDFIVATLLKPEASPFGTKAFSPTVLNKTGEPFVLEADSKQRFAQKMFRLLKQEGKL